MKFLKISSFLFLFLTLSSTIYSQTHRYSTKHKNNNSLKSRFGITAGYTNYVLDSNVLFTKSQPGYLIGIMSTTQFTDNLELLIGFSYMHHRMKFIGKEDLDAEQEDLKFKLENFDVPFILNYNFLNLNNDNLKIGINTGFTVSLIQQYIPSEDSKENYIVEPINLQVKYLDFDGQNNNISLNTYIPVGLSVEYGKIVCNLRYNIGLSDPFRRAPFFNNVFETKSSQNFYSVSFTYFWKNN